MAFDLVQWLCETALPFWETEGFDATSGMFVERVALDGRPITSGSRRLMVQARQIIAFVDAKEVGWHANEKQLEIAANSLLNNFFLSTEFGWIFSVDSDGCPYDKTRDLYAHAFVLAALARLKRLTGDDCWLDIADQTLSFMDTSMATLATGGYGESSSTATTPRRQNPHMHLFEAFLALCDVAPGRGYEQRADAIFALLEARFLHGPRPVLVEFYDPELRPTRDHPFAYEPGHHFEWAWLLSQYAENKPSVIELASKLWNSAAADCFARGNSVFDEISGTGHPLRLTRRLWSHAEALRASTIGFPRAPDVGQNNATPATIASAMHRYFFEPAQRGCWIDQLDAQGRPASSFVAASSLYHIVGAACALHGRVWEPP